MKSEKGLTLIELMISLALMALVSVTGFYILTAAKQMSESSRSRLLAANAARSALEQIKNTGLQNVGALSTSGFIPSTLPGGTMTIATNPANLSSATIATVTVTVNWQGPRNRTEQLQISTMRSAY
jgi:prepilin-type N-terminal cleavage/methylation domain-containing protein